MSMQYNNLLFLGLPKSGKTTYFAIMVDYLQHIVARSSNINFRTIPSNDGKEITSKFMREAMKDIKNQRWPEKTQDYNEPYRFMITRKGVSVRETEEFSFWDIFQPWRWSEEGRTKTVSRDIPSYIHYHDYPGEAFEAAFGDNYDDSYKDAAEHIKSSIKSAAGIFLILDAEALYSGDDDDSYFNTLLSLCRRIYRSNPNVKLAVIFSKLELCPGVNFTELLLENYKGVYTELPGNRKFFHVKTVGSVEQNDEGEWIPPKRVQPSGILEPLEWMLGYRVK